MARGGNAGRYIEGRLNEIHKVRNHFLFFSFGLLSQSFRRGTGWRSRGKAREGTAAGTSRPASPDRFCCAVLVCGYLERSFAGIPAAFFNLAAFDVMPVWAFHGTDDSFVDVGGVVGDALKERGTPVKYTRYAEGLSPPCVTKAKDLVGHGSYELAFKEEGLWEWIEAQRRQA